MRPRMKTRVTTFICMAAFLLTAGTPLVAQEKPSPWVKAADAVVVRPVCFLSTIAGGAVFVLSLPVTAIRKEIKPAANELVTKPAWKTFKRPLGDMDALSN